MTKWRLPITAGFMSWAAVTGLVGCFTKAVYYTSIGSNGTLGTWQTYQVGQQVLYEPELYKVVL